MGRKERDEEMAVTKRRLEERIVDSSISGSSVADTTSASQTTQESYEDFELPDLNDETPENTRLPDHAPQRKMVQLLHAGLVATIGVLYSMSLAQ
jgi:hypothetical protein